MQSAPCVGGWSGLPWTRTARPSSTVTSIAQVSGQSCGQAARTTAETISKLWHSPCSGRRSARRVPAQSWDLTVWAGACHASHRIHPRRRRADRRAPARHPCPPRALLRGEAHLRPDRRAAHVVGHPDPPRHGNDRHRRDPQERHQRSRAVGLRADMDALPITENNTFEHRSTQPARCTRAATTATRRCCSPPPSTSRSTATTTARSTSSSSRPKKAAAARAR